MTSLEILKKFNYRFGSMHDLDANVLNTDEISEAINFAIKRAVTEYVNTYEINEISRIALEQLTITHECVENETPTFITISDNSIVYTIPSDCFAVVLAQADINYTEDPNEVVSDTILVKPVTHDYYWRNINNPFKQPYRKLAWRINYKEGHELISDDTYGFLAYTIRYVKYPTEFNVMTNSEVELNEKEIDIIVDLAVAKAFEFLVNNGRVKGTVSVPEQTGKNKE